MTEIKHTPWEFRKYPGMSIGSIVGNNGRIIAENVNENFAEVIIRARNAHDDLVAAAENANAALAEFFAPLPIKLLIEDERAVKLSKAKDALSKALAKSKAKS